MAQWVQTPLQLACFNTTALAGSGSGKACTVAAPVARQGGTNSTQENVFLKVPSVAWMHEWLMIGSLRPSA